MPKSDYEFGPELGRGSFGVVFKVERAVDGTPLVCKQINLAGMGQKAQDEAKEEVTLLRRVSSGSTYIVQYIDSFLEEGILCLVMEFCARGDLCRFLRQRSKECSFFSENTVWKLILQVGEGLRWLHENRVVHRDIKPLNIFLTAEEDCRIGDLGIARVLRQDCLARTLIGTPHYLSPEVCNSQPYNLKSDVWAYGCVVYEICTLRRPFEGKNSAALVIKIMQGVPCWPVSSEYSPELREMIFRCLQPDPVYRATIADLLDLPASRLWAGTLGLVGGGMGEKSKEPHRVRAWKRIHRLHRQISRLSDDMVRDLDAPAREVWDNLYLLFRAKMASEELSVGAYAEIEKHIFEELPIESTEFIFKVTKILQLELEAQQGQQELM
eukprot:TRINITY_DN69268_c0_g1_i1.p1 TRINITY_DN69268_c0_g1~~TRINITY_DN69268_c0_g1_i1.p1  ORF type:complete len:382 (+),score=60.45 TRINITY_DN69268_c0_g1_i1:109-1254(+)